MTTKQLIKDVSDISDIVIEMHKDIHTYMNDIGHMVKENYNKIDEMDIITCSSDREIRNLTDIVEKETTELSNEIDNLKENIEGWIDDLRNSLQGESSHIDLGTIHDSIETLAQEQDKLKDEIKDIREKVGEILTILYSLPQ